MIVTGSTIVAALLEADAGIAAMVLPGDIMISRLSDDTGPRALLVRNISTVERLRLRRKSQVRWIDRVAVSVRAESYEDQIVLERLVIACCAGRTGDIAGGRNASILHAGMGPDIAGIVFEKTIDFRVSFDADA